MFAQALARRLSRAGVHYGWAIVAIVFLLALTTAGCMGISGALIVPLTKEFGWSTEQISVALALRIVLFGLMAPFICDETPTDSTEAPNGSEPARSRQVQPEREFLPSKSK
jgi:hypothetical protein